jgi:molecular chaperone GrpE
MRIPVRVEGLKNDFNQQDERSVKMNYPYKNMNHAHGIDEDLETEYDESPACETVDENAGYQEYQHDEHKTDDISDVQNEDLDWKGMYVRMKADFENHKRNTKAQRDRLSGIGKEAVIDDVLPLVDHMEMAIKAAQEGESGEAILKGIEIVYKQLISTLQKHGVERVPSIGQTFDPKIHEAIGVAPAQNAPPDTVIREVRPGFIRAGKLIRPASVIVSQ